MRRSRRSRRRPPQPSVESLPFTIVIDDRERRGGYTWPNATYARMETGDYAIFPSWLREEMLCVVERKSLSDIYQCIGGSRQRFVRELERLTDWAFAVVVIESTLAQFLHPPPKCRVSSSSALGSIVTWSMIYNIPFLFADSKQGGRLLTERYLLKAWDKREQLLSRRSDGGTNT